MNEERRIAITVMAVILAVILTMCATSGCYLTRPIETTAVVTRAYWSDGMWCWKHLVDTGAWLEVCSFNGGDLGGFTYGDLYVKHTGSIPVASTNEQ